MTGAGNQHIPRTQRAVQLTGPGQLRLNDAKKVHLPGPHQILCRVEAVGLCFSDLKLLKQFSAHVRKGPVVNGINPAILAQIPSYVPADLPTVPGHEAAVRVVAVGDCVHRVKPGQRFLVQTDYRWLPTAESNAAFGYNFEGALQEYVLMDQRIITSPTEDFMLIAIDEQLSASAVALVEPWACVENAYTEKQRRNIKAGGTMLVVAEGEVNKDVFRQFLERFGRPRRIVWVSESYPEPLGPQLDIPTTQIPSLSGLTDTAFDDIVYFGCKTTTVQNLFDRLGPGGLINIVLCGGRFDRQVLTPVGKVHYGSIRIIGTPGHDPAESMSYISDTPEIRPGNKINIIGSAGPMGAMHVIRNLCRGIGGISVFAGDIDEERLAGLSKIAAPLAAKNNLIYRPYHPRQQPQPGFDYVVLMVPEPALVADAVKTAAAGAIINIFAGIPATVTAAVDLNVYIRRHLYFVGTSGSVLADMHTVLANLQAGKINTNLSVAAVCGLEGAIEGISAVEKRLVAGKIVVYPACRKLPLVTLEQLPGTMPAVAGALADGCWSSQAEKMLLQMYQR
jgi:threonine dehydrogenase-like Zn-dependent dehydrogenase